MERYLTFRYCLERPEDEVDIHVFRVTMTTSLEEVTCTRSVVPADDVSDPSELLCQIIEPWQELQIEEEESTWKLT